MHRHLAKILCLALAIVMAFSLAACANNSDNSAGEPEGTYKSGSYTATTKAHNGDLTVKVDFSTDAITAVEVTKHSETAGIADPPIKQIPEQIVEHQSLGIDAITGATVTSNAIIAAVADCVNQAGGDAEALKNTPVSAGPGEMIIKNVDVVVVGGGGAGVAAAASATQNGASVLLLEKGSAIGGNTMIAGGGNAVWNNVNPELVAKTPTMTGQLDSLRAFLDRDPADLPEGYAETLTTLQEEIEEYLAGDTSMMFDSVELHIMQTYYGGLRQDLDDNWIYGNFDLVKMLCTESPKAIEWLKGFGSEFTDALSEPIGSMWLRSLAPKTSNAHDFLELPAKYVTDNGGEILVNATAKSLIVEGGAVVGVTGSMSDGTAFEVRAKSVVLATGGFGSNTPMVLEYNNYWAGLSPDIGTTNASTLTGDGINMAVEAGAALTGMEFAQLMPIGWADTGKLALGAGNNVMYVGPDGTRFTNEYAERDVISQAAFDVGGIFYEIKSQSQDVANQLSRVGDGTNMVFAADTLEELAEMIGVPADALVAEVEKYNGYVNTGTDPEHGKNVFSASVEAPYMARVLSPSIHHTMGGVAIDTSCRVLNSSGTAVPGLYAAGEVTGGIHAGNRLGGNAIADINVFGKIAGESAAKGA